MSQSPRVSLLIPVRNAAKFLDQCLESIRAQSFRDWELVVVNDGSTDETGRILALAAEGDRRIRVISQPAKGIAHALQRGCDLCVGEFVARLDADDWMHPDRLAQQVRFLDLYADLDVVSCKVRHGGHTSAQVGYSLHVAWINSLMTADEIAHRRFVESPVAHPSVMFRRILLERHGGYSAGDFPEDYELWLRWMDAGVRFGKVEQELLIWNDPPARLSRTDPRYRTESFYRVKCIYLARWLKAHVSSSKKIWLWGAGRVTRQRFKLLEDEGIRIHGFIDVDVKKLGRKRDGRLVVGPQNLPSLGSAFVIVGVSSRGARELISAELGAQGRVEGIDYVLAA